MTPRTGRSWWRWEPTAVRQVGTPEHSCQGPDRVRHRDELNVALQQRLSQRTAGEWLVELADAGIPAGPINTVADAIDLAATLGLDPVHEITSPDRVTPFRTIAHPIRFSATPARYDTPPPPAPAS